MPRHAHPRGAVSFAYAAALCSLATGVHAQCVDDSRPFNCCDGFRNQLTFSQPYAGMIDEKCVSRPVDTVCYAFTDDYVWLLSLVAIERFAFACPRGQVEGLRLGHFADGSANPSLYLHVLHTDLVMTLTPCRGAAALDPAMCRTSAAAAAVRPGGGANDAGDATDGGNKPSGAAASFLPAGTLPRSPAERRHNCGCMLAGIRGRIEPAVLGYVVTLTALRSRARSRKARAAR